MNGPNWKPDHVMSKVRRHIKRRETKSAEDRIMAAVRREDRYCRFPLCGCGKLKLTLDVAHAGEQGHRKMGGNRSLSATQPQNLILICRPRHRAHKFALDKHTLRVEPLTERGLRGPVRWWIDRASLNTEVTWYLNPAEGEELLATETAPHSFEPFTEAQAAILRYLATMEC